VFLLPPHKGGFFMELIQHISASNTRKIIKSYIPEYSGKPIVIAVAGGSCSGKTSTILRYLSEDLGKDATHLSIDNFQLGEDFPKKDTSEYRWDDPDNFALDEIKNAITSLINNQITTIPIFNLEKNIRVGVQKIFPNKYVIVEGIYAFYNQLESLADMKIYLETPFFGRFMRRLFRFTLEDHINIPEVPLRHMVGPTYRAHRDHVSKQKEFADVVIHMPYIFEETFLKFHLNDIHDPLTKPLDEIYVQSDDEVILGRINDVFVVVYKEQILYSAKPEKEVLDSLKHINFTES
jgi:uridine kinase